MESKKEEEKEVKKEEEEKTEVKVDEVKKSEEEGSSSSSEDEEETKNEEEKKDEKTVEKKEGKNEEQRVEAKEEARTDVEEESSDDEGDVEFVQEAVTPHKVAPVEAAPEQSAERTEERESQQKEEEKAPLTVEERNEQKREESAPRSPSIPAIDLKSSLGLPSTTTSSSAPAAFTSALALRVAPFLDLANLHAKWTELVASDFYFQARFHQHPLFHPSSLQRSPLHLGREWSSPCRRSVLRPRPSSLPRCCSRFSIPLGAGARVVGRWCR